MKYIRTRSIIIQIKRKNSMCENMKFDQSDYHSNDLISTIKFTRILF